MLTREEAKKIRDAFGEVEVWAGCPGCAKLKEKVGEITHVILELTEKPKREIKVKVGDIYKSKHQNVLITVTHVHSDGYFVGSDGGLFTRNGLRGELHTLSSFLELDLSKRYKLVEVEDE
jgi:hypothetical protein